MTPIKLRASAKNNEQVASYLSAFKRGKNNQHVVPNGNKWQIKKAGSSRATQTFETQKEAIVKATQIAKNNKSELFIHGRDGRIRERNSYGRDPFSTKG